MFPILKGDIIAQYNDLFGAYYHSESEYRNYGEELTDIILQARRDRSQLNKVIFITDLSEFLSRTGLSDTDFIMIYEEGQKVGLHLVYFVTKASTQLATPILRYLKTKIDVAILAAKLTGQTYFTRSSTGVEPELQNDEIYWHQRDIQTKL